MKAEKIFEPGPFISKEYLETYVWKLAPDAAAKKSGGSLAKYAKDSSFTRTLPVQ